MTEDVDVRKVWREHLKTLHNPGNEVLIVNVCVCVFNGVRGIRYFKNEVIGREKAEEGKSVR